MTTETQAETPTELERPSPKIPRWIVKTIWSVHRTAYALTGGRLGLRPDGPSQWGMLRLTTVGRRTGNKRVAILGYLEDGPNLVTPAMNGWAEPEPAWWLNLQSNPDASVELPGGRRRVVARAATPDERARLWARFIALGSSAYTNANAATRPRETAIVVLQPRP
jgi:deazaflavin-dependent oxidoreductase (nitroreductase family)